MATLTNLFKALSLAQIKGVNINSSSLMDGQILQYDGETSNWINITNSAISPPKYEFITGTKNGTFNVNITESGKTTTTPIGIYGLGTGAYADKFELDATIVPVLATAVDISRDTGKYLQYTRDGWVLSIPSTTGGTPTSISTATAIALGGVKIGYPTANSINKDYAVQLDSNDKAYVSVPWTDTVYSAAANGGLSLSTNAFSVKLDSTISGLALGTNGLKLDTTKVPVLTTASSTTGYVYWSGTAWQLNTSAGSAPTSISTATTIALGGIKIGYTAPIGSVDKNYAVQLDSNDKAYVSVPWTDTVYSAAANGGLSLSTNAFSVKLDSTISGLALGTNGLKLDTTKVPVLTTASTTTGYVYWSGTAWQLKTPTSSGSTPTSISTATVDVLGGIKIGYTAPIGSVDKNYAVQLDSNDAAYVTVPWVNTVYNVAANGGLSLSTNEFSVKLDATAATGTALATSGLTTSTNGLKIDNTKVPVLTTASSTTGYVYWSGTAWQLNTPTSSTPTSISAGSGISIDAANKISVDDTIIPKRYYLDILDTSINKTYKSNGVDFTSDFTASNSDFTISCNLTKYPSSIMIINKLNYSLIISKSPIFTLDASKLSIKIPVAGPASFASGIIISMVI